MVKTLETIGWVLASKYRLNILKGLAGGPIIPTDIQKLTNIKIAHVSRGLKELVDKDLASCATPGLRKNKFYYLTTKGLAILKEIAVLEGKMKRE